MLPGKTNSTGTKVGAAQEFHVIAYLVAKCRNARPMMCVLMEVVTMRVTRFTRAQNA